MKQTQLRRRTITGFAPLPMNDEEVMRTLDRAEEEQKRIEQEELEEKLDVLRFAKRKPRRSRKNFRPLMR